MKCIASCLIASVLLLAADASATVAVGGNLSASGSSIDGNATGTSSGTFIAASPSVDILLDGRWSVGIGARLIRQTGKSETPAGITNEFTATFLQPNLSLGYFLPIGEFAAFWPVLRAGYGAGFAHNETPAGTRESSARIFEATLTPQILLLPTKSFFLRFTPGEFGYRHTSWRDQQGSGGLLGAMAVFTMGVGVIL